MVLSYAIYDVFTETRLAGNPLAVVFDADELDTEQMQSIAREFNLSETAFVIASSNPSHTAKLRIFTPGRELPFAGHPTVGSAIALAEQKAAGTSMEMVSVLEEEAGAIRCAIRLREGEPTFAEFDLPKKSAQFKLTAGLDKQGIADALSISVKHIGFENHVASVWNAGIPFLMVPVKDIGVLGEVEFDAALWERVAPLVGGHLASAYLYCRGNNGNQFQARMFSSDMGIAEDPATGSAVAALSGAIHHFDQLVEGYHPIVVRQGVEMGRPSTIHLHIDTSGGEIVRARIGGHAVRIAVGKLEI